MASPKPTSGAGGAHGRERRASRREALRLAAELRQPNAAPRTGRVQDYCLGGMLIRIPGTGPLPVGAVLTVRCTLPPDSGVSHVEFRGRVVRADGDHIGLAFIDPELSALQQLQATARAQRDAANRGAGRQDDCALSDQETEDAVRECGERVRETLEPLIERFYRDINEALFQAAEDSRDIAVQNANLQGLSELNRRRPMLRDAFVSAAQRRLAEAEAGTLPDAQEAEAPGGGGVDALSLVEPKAFEEWLAVSDLVTKVENDQHPVLNALTRRLGVLFAAPVDDHNNPFGPRLFAASLRDALADLDLAHSARLVCYRALKTGVRAVAGPLYEALNEVLVKHGVLPKLVPELARSEPEAHGTEPPAAPQQPPAVQQPPAAPQPAAAPQAPATSPPPAGAAPASGPAAAPERPAAGVPADLFQLVGDLRALQSRLGRPQVPAGASPGATAVPGAGTGGDGAAPAPAPLRPYNTTELLAALSSPAFRRHPRGAGDASAPGAARSRLEAALARAGGDADAKSIPEQQGRVIDVAGDVFSTLLADLQIAHSVRPWIEQLEAPVLKMALLDDRLFIDKAHIVRVVIDKLSRLEVLAGSENEEQQAALRRAFQWVVNLINTEFDGTEEVFHRVDQQLDLLLRVQDETYRKNLDAVIAECTREEPATEAEEATAPDAGPEAGEAAAPEAGAEAQEETDEWLRRVRRLREEHWVLFDAKSAEPKRLKVAWIAPRAGKYVFVNVLGRKERILGEGQLAALLRAGEAVVLDAADEPAMDRAQYTMLQNLHRQLLYQSTHDPLTGLINRAEFEKCLGEAVADAKYANTRHALVFIDVDQFKVVNNTLGFEAGDALLKALSELLKARVGGDHVLARVGADQFGMLLMGHSIDDALAVVEEQLDELHEYRVPWEDQRLSVSVSVGLVGVHAHGEGEAALLQAAETSCGVAKELGGGRIQIYHSRHAGLSRRKEEMKWAVEIDRALDEDALSLRCQKIVPLQPHLPQQDWYELLLGLSGDLGERLALQEFIKAAEHYSRIIEVDRWVIRNAFEWIANHEDELLGIAGFTINLSGPSLNDERLIRYVNEQAERTGVAMQSICFEITETAGITSLSDASDFIHVIKSTGCRFSLDDFGSGMSSYAYLKNLPVDFLKIDGAFVQELTEDSSDFAVVKSVCEVGHFMDKAVIAEFAQNEHTVELLRELGVDYVQGYAVERPHALKDLLKG